MKDTMIAFLVFSFVADALPTQRNTGVQPESPSPAISFEVTSVSLGKPVSGFREESLVVSPDGKRIAYAAGDFAREDLRPDGPRLRMVAVPERTVKVVVDGVEGAGYDGVGVPVFSPDGEHVAYCAVLKTAPMFETVVVDGARSKACNTMGPCGAVGEPVFSRDGRHVAYRAWRWKLFTQSQKWRVVLDGSEGDGYERMTDPVFSPDGTRVAYIVRQGKKTLLISDGQTTPAGSDEPVGLPAFSHDGKRIGYIARRGGRSLVVVDGVEGPAYDWIERLVFSPDGRLAYAARRGQTALIVVESGRREELSPYSDVGDPVFSPDGRRIAYWAQDGTNVRVVADGVAGRPYDEIGKILFGPDGEHFAFEARLGSQWRLVVDGVEGPEYSLVRGFPSVPMASAPTLAGRDRRQLYRNGWRFERADLLTYIAVRGGELVRSQVRIRPRHHAV